MTTVAELNGIMRMDASQFVAGMGAATRSLDGFDKKTQSTSQTVSKVGGELTHKVTLPLAAIGAGALAVGLDFNQSMTNISALVGVADKDLAKMRETTLSLSSATGKGPQELGDALYFITSAGLEGKQAMDALDASAKASAAGLGSTATVADMVTSAMGAYATSGLSAATATDVLTAAVREGKAEPDEMAASLGKVLPIASAMHVKFQDVAGAVAVMSRSGLDASESTTALRGMLSALLKPTKEAEDALNGVGLTSEGLRQTLGEQGLLPTLQLLQQRFNGDSTAMSQVFGDVRGLTGVMNILGQDSETVSGVMGRVANSTGDAGKAFKKASESDGFKMKQSLAEIQVALVKVSDVILPFVSSVGSGMAKAASAFGSLPGPVQSTTVAFLAVAAASGPVLSIIGGIGTTMSKVAPLFPTVAGGLDKVRNSAMMQSEAMSKVTTGLGATAAAAGVGIAVWQMWSAAMDSAREAGKKMATDALDPITKQMGSGTMTIDDMNKRIGQTGQVINDLSAEVKSSSAPWDADYRAQLDASKGSMQEVHDKLVAVKDMATEMAHVSGENADQFGRWLLTVDGGPDKFKTTEDALKAYRIAAVEATGVTHDDAVAMGDNAKSYLDHAAAVKQSDAALKSWTDAVKAQFDPIFGMLDAMNGLKDQQDQVTDAQLALNAAVKEHGPNSREAAAAAKDYQRANEGLMKSNVDLDVAARTLNESVKSGKTSMDEAKAAVDGWAASGRISSAQAETLKQKLGGVAWNAAVVGQQHPIVTVGADTTQFDMSMVHVGQSLAAIANSPAMQTLLKAQAGNVHIDGIDVGGGAQKLFGFASGTASMPDGRSLVGERGPELLEKRGAHVSVLNADRTRETLATGGAGESNGGGITIGQIVVNPPPGMSPADARFMARQTVDAIRKLERENAT